MIVGVGLEQGYKGITRSFMENTNTDSMDDRVEHAYTALGVFGHLARMAVFGLIGWFLIKAALDYDPDEAVALDGAPPRSPTRPTGTAPRHRRRGPDRLRRLLARRVALPARLADRQAGTEP